MKMDDNELKSLLQEAMEYEADCIMEEVNSALELKDAIAPEEIHDKLLQQINEHKAAVANGDANLSQEQKELIRLGKIYKKKRGRRKYIILMVAVICGLGVGMVSFGDGEKVFSEMKRMLGDREQTVVNTDDGDGTVVDEIASEEQAYEQIEDKLGFYPVKLIYMPEGMEFVEVVIEEDSQNARIYYADEAEKLVSYYITTNYRDGSASTDVEDNFIQEYEKEINGVIILFREYQVEENEECRWCIDFTHGNAQYSLIVAGIEQEEVEEIAENLFFS